GRGRRAGFAPEQGPPVLARILPEPLPGLLVVRRAPDAGGRSPAAVGLFVRGGDRRGDAVRPAGRAAAARRQLERRRPHARGGPVPGRLVSAAGGRRALAEFAVGPRRRTATRNRPGADLYRSSPSRLPGMNRAGWPRNAPRGGKGPRTEWTTCPFGPRPLSASASPR